MADEESGLAPQERASSLNLKELERAVTLELSLIEFSHFREVVQKEAMNLPRGEQEIWRGFAHSDEYEIGMFFSTDSSQGTTRLRIRITLRRDPERPLSDAERSLTLDDIPPEARARTVAIALSELVRSRLISLEHERLRVQAQDLELRSEKLERRELHQEEQSRLAESLKAQVGGFQLSASVLASGSLTGSGPMWGGEGGFSFQQWAAWRWSLETAYSVISSEVALGYLGVKRFAVSLGGDFHFAALQALQFGPRMQFHYFSAQGENFLGEKEDRRSGYALSFALRTSFELALSRHFLLRTHVEAGPIVRPMEFTVSGQDAFAFKELYLQGGLGAIWRPSMQRRTK